MRKLIVVAVFFSLTLVSIISCKKDTAAPPNIDCNTAIANMDPVYVFAVLNELYGIERDASNPNRNSVEIPPHTGDSIYKILNAIRALKNPHSDSVFNLFKVAYKDPAEMQFIEICLPDSMSFHTNTALQNIIKKYNLTVQTFEGINPPRVAISFKACPLVNTFALERELYKATNDIIYTYNWLPNHDGGIEYDDVNMLTITTDSTDFSTLVKFGVQFGDCPAGCLTRYTWVFKVFADFSAKHVTSFGNL
jgi:hypothetical protein